MPPLGQQIRLQQAFLSVLIIEENRLSESDFGRRRSEQCLLINKKNYGLGCCSKIVNAGG